MIKQFSYNVSAYVQNKLNGEQVVISQQHIGEVEITETNYIVEFAIAEDELINYINVELSNFISANNLSLNDIDITKFIVNSNDPDVQVYFEKSDTNEVLINTPIIAWVQNQYDTIPEPTLSGEPLSYDRIRWTWNIVENCSYILWDHENNMIATIGVGINNWIETDLEANKTYLRCIQAFDGSLYSEITSIEAVTTPHIWWSPVVDFPEFENEFEETVELSLIEESKTYSPLIQSGIGHGDDCLVELYQENKEVFKCEAIVSSHDIIEDQIFEEKVFQYRQKSIGKLDRLSRFGKFEGKIYAHPKDQYSFDINANVYAPIKEDKVIDINIETSANGYISVVHNFTYELSSNLLNKEINLTRKFDYILNVTYKDYSTDFLMTNNFIKTITNNDGKIILTMEDIALLKPKNGVVEYQGNNYSDFLYTIKSVSNTEVKLTFDGLNEMHAYGLRNILAECDPFYGEYNGIAIIQDLISTPIDIDINSKMIDVNEIDLNLLTEEFPTIDNQDYVAEEDRKYTGDLNDVSIFINNVNNFVNIRWETSNTNQSGIDDNIIISTNRITGEYKTTHIITKTINSGSSGEIELITVNELKDYKPYYNGTKWPFDIGLIQYKIIGKYDDLDIKFSNDEITSNGLNNIIALINPKNVQYTKTVSFIDFIYDYEFKDGYKIVGNTNDIIPTDNNDQLYIGDHANIIYTIINNLPRQDVNINSNGDIGVLITVPKMVREIQVVDGWYNDNVTVIDLSKYEYTGSAHYSLIKEGGHNNTIARSKDNATQLAKNIGDIIYSSSGILYIYAIEEIITLEDISYSQWGIGIVNQNDIQTSFVCNLQDIISDDIYDIQHILELSPSTDLSYEFNNNQFTIYSDTSIATNKISLQVGLEIDGISNEFTIYNTSKIFNIPITIQNPKIINPGKFYTIKLKSSNPNMKFEISEDFDINNLNNDLLIDIPINASILIQNQTRWIPTIRSGYYYLSLKENYLYGENNINKAIINPGHYRCTPRPNNGIVLLTDENNIPMNEVFSPLDITEEVKVINYKYIKTTYTNIDLTSVTINDQVIPGIIAINNIIILPSDIDDDTINIRYRVINSYFVEYFENYIEIKTHTGSLFVNVYYETGEKRDINNINLNPLRGANASGFIYIKE